MALWVSISFVIGIIIGNVVTLSISYRPQIGKLRIDKSDIEPYIFLELESGVYELKDGQRISLIVDVSDYVTHK